MSKPDALVVLNGGVMAYSGNVIPNLDTQARITAALGMARSRGIGTIAMVGREASEMKLWAEEERNEADGFVVVADSVSRDTVGNAHFTKTNLYAPNGWSGIEVLAGDYQAKRAEWIFDKVFWERRRGSGSRCRDSLRSH